MARPKVDKDESAPVKKTKTSKDVVEEPPAEEKPKKTRKSKAVEAEEPAAEEKPKKTARKSKAAEAEEPAAEEKPKKTRKSKAADSEEHASEEKPKKSRKTKTEKSDEGEEKPKKTARKSKAVKEDSDDAEEKPKRVRKVVTLEDVEEKFSSLLEMLDSEMKKVKDEVKGSGGLKFFRSVKSHVRELNTDCGRLAKTKQHRKRREGASQTGGFNKPLHITAELASFLGRKSDELVSRNDVTRYVCQYIKEHNLQNPEDRRLINGDAKLNKLLDYHPGEEDPLRYPTIQKKINRHYVKADVPTVVEESDSD